MLHGGIRVSHDDELCKLSSKSRCCGHYLQVGYHHIWQDHCCLNVFKSRGSGCQVWKNLYAISEKQIHSLFRFKYVRYQMLDRSDVPMFIQ